MTTKTLYLHIGTPKTATSTLQYFCDENRAALNALGYDYLQLPFTYLYTGPRRNGHFLLGYTGDDGVTPKKTLVARRKQGYALLAEAFERYDNVILSEEDLWTNTIKKKKNFFWKELLAHAEEHAYDIRVIVYLRRQDQFIESMYNQLAKEGRKVAPFAQWMDKPETQRRIAYYDNLERIAGFVGRDAIDVHVYDRAQLEQKGGIHVDFLRALGLEMSSAFSLPAGNQNDGALGPNVLAIKRGINVSPSFNRAHNRVFVRAAHVCDACSQAPAQRFLSPDETKQLLSHLDEGNARIVAEYMHGDGPLFDSAVGEFEKWSPDTASMYEDTVTYFQALNTAQNKRMKINTANAEDEGDEHEDEANCYVDVSALEQSVNLNTARCLGEYFVRRQEAIETGETVFKLKSADVAVLVDAVRTASETVLHAEGEDTHVYVLPLRALEKSKPQEGAIEHFFHRVVRVLAHPSKISRWAKRIVLSR